MSSAYDLTLVFFDQEISLTALFKESKHVNMDAAGNMIPFIWTRIEDTENVATLDEKMDFAPGVVASGMRDNMNNVFMPATGRMADLEEACDYAESFWEILEVLHPGQGEYEECKQMLSLFDTAMGG